ncbi:MAG: ribosome-associated translation inhibitor RaiA [Bacilli bacterium]|nr:ribosome-associated translation inhibitor RaiA [Bacilli bacterium]
MKVTVRTKNKIDFVPKIKEHAEDKLAKLDQYFSRREDLEATVLCKEYDDGKVVEITIPTKNIILRAEVKADTFLNALDSAVDKLESQIRRHKSKIYSSMKRRAGVAQYYSTNSDFDLEKMKTELMVTNLVKSKSVELKPMTPEDAITQMEMLGHNFFVFLNVETNKVCVVYLREDHDYGIIETSNVD